MRENVVRIGCGAGFWGDSPEGPRQLVELGNIDYLVLDYLAEVTMSILARTRQKNAELGYATDFIHDVVLPFAATLESKGIKVIANAGGVNPAGCKIAIERELARLGVALKVVAVVGDDVMPGLDELVARDVREMFTGAPTPRGIISANAYLGALPIAAALDAGADIVVTGRCVDSAIVLGPLIHEFGWRPNQYDLLAAGSLAGHVVECGPQCTGGFFTDWKLAKDTWDDIGFPIAECKADGTFVVTKPEGTGGIVTLGTVAEQVTYETGDPRNYVMPDVVCDFSEVTLREVGKNRVEVRGARGRSPTSTYKVSATYPDGFRCMATLLVKGIDAAAKAEAVAQAILRRTRRIFDREGLGDYVETSIELLGAEATYGPHARTRDTREVVLKLGVRHVHERALSIFGREIYPTSTATVQGVAGVFGGRPKVQSVVRPFSFLLPKDHVDVTIECDGSRIAVDIPGGSDNIDELPDQQRPAVLTTLSSSSEGPTVRVPLIELALARSGDKADTSNIAVLARDPEYWPLLWEQLTPDTVRAYMAHLVKGNVERFAWPGLHGMNFLLHGALGGGGVVSLRYDPQGKGHAQMLLDFPIDVPRRWVVEGRVRP